VRTDDVQREIVLGQMEALSEFFVKADMDKDRKSAALTFEKQLKKVCRLELRGMDDFAIEDISERVQLLLNPAAAYKKFTERAATPARAPRAAAQHPVTPTRHPGPAYYQQAPAQAYSPAPAACPPGYQLTPIAAPLPVAQATIAPQPYAPPGGGRPLPRGIASTKPGEIFPPAHFTRPCTYCSHAGHAGDSCWKTYPELRALNGH
jgi:hypothetical protein